MLQYVTMSLYKKFPPSHILFCDSLISRLETCENENVLVPHFVL